MFKKTLFIVTLLLCSHEQSAHAQQAASFAEAYRWQAKIEEVKMFKDQGIPFLSWDKEIILVESTAFLHFTNIQGKFSEKVTHATLNSKSMIIQEDGTFNIHFGFPSESKVFTITATDAENKVYRMQYKINPIDHQEIILDKVPPHRWRFSLGTGLTLISFRQKNVTPFDQWAVTLKGSANYRIVPEKLELGLSSFYNAIPFASKSPVGYKIQYLGVNTRLVWTIIGAPSPFRLNLSGGLYYNTSLSTVGFTNMYGPQLYPELIYVFNNGNSLLFYGKYSPALSQSNSISFKDNRETALGMHYSFPISFTKRMSVGVDLSQLSLSVPSGDWASTNTYSLTAGISF